MFKRLSNFRTETRGAITVLGLFMFMACCVIGGLALDVSNAYMARTQLQANADAVAHAALYNRDTMGEVQAIDAALEIAEVMMPTAIFGKTIEAADIRFGTWNAAGRTFTPLSGSKEAVFVDAQRSQSKSNGLGTYFLRFAGINSWDVRRGTVYSQYQNPCTTEGFVAEGVVDMQSNNSFAAGFCIHSNNHVEFNNGSTFADGVIVSMPDKANVVVPDGGMESNPGLAKALRDGAFKMRVLNKLPEIYADLELGGVEYAPSYITSPVPVTVTNRTNVTMSNFTPGRVHKVSCSGGQTLSFKANEVFSNIVIVTSCKVSFGSGNVFDNVILFTTSTDSSSLKAASGLSIGLNDNCAAGGGSQFMTYGGAKFAANLEMHGGQILALGNVEFAARANGIQGASIIAGGEIDGTSNTHMGFCNGAGMEGNFESLYFHMAS